MGGEENEPSFHPHIIRGYIGFCLASRQSCLTVVSMVTIRYLRFTIYLSASIWLQCQYTPGEGIDPNSEIQTEDKKTKG